MRRVLLVLLAMLAPRAFAQSSDSHPIDVQLDACQEVNLTTKGMAGCYNAAEIAWDAELNRFYQMVMDGMEPEAQEALREAQRRWLAYRDAEFASIIAFYGAMDGRMWQVVLAGARMAVVRHRALELAGYAWALDPDGS